MSEIPFAEETSVELEKRENVAISQIEAAYQQFSQKYRKKTDELTSQRLLELLRSMAQEANEQAKFQAEATRSVYQGVRIKTPVKLLSHLKQKDLPYPSISAGRVSTCALTTVLNSLQVLGVYNPQAESEESLLQQVDPRHIQEDGSLLHIEVTEKLLKDRGLDVKATNNLIVVAQTLRQGGLVSLNKNNHHIVLISGFQSDLSTGELTFRVSDPSEVKEGYLTTQELAKYLSDWRFPMAVVISRT